MLGFLFGKKEKEINNDFNAVEINQFYSKLKEIFDYESISDERKTYLRELIEQHQYLPYPHIKALEELTPAETLFGLELKWETNKVFKDGEFDFQQSSVLARNSVKNSDWIKKEGHDIKLINLAGLGNGNKSEDAGTFIDWLKQLLILPSSNLSRNIFATTIYLTPFHPREFGCAYLPSSNEVSPNLENKKIKNVGFDVKMQVQAFITLAQLAGHPVIYDILPQTGRYSKTVLANPHIARWFDINELTKQIESSLDKISQKLEAKFDKEDVEIIRNIYKKGVSGDLSSDYQQIYCEFEKEMDILKKEYSTAMTHKDNQIKLVKKVKEVVSVVLGVKTNQMLMEKDIVNQGEVVKKLISEGLWTAPGGAWCSAGVPVYDKMSDCKSFPIFKHYNFEGTDVSNFANLDCQTPYYFTYLENGQENKQVGEFFVKFMECLQREYNFDGFRIDHLDHIVDKVSEKNKTPISYRTPRNVLEKLNSNMKKKIPHFASLAEYMLGDNFFEEYHAEMKFDLLWGNDIPAQSEKTPEKIMEDNQNLSNYNTKNFSIANLSILKTYNNQDGEFRVIDRYPGQLGERGALFKWFKYKMLPGGKYAQRPVMYIDGDESFTKLGIERTIGNEVSMIRNNSEKFFARFDAINRFVKSQEIITEGEAQIIRQDEDGFVSWIISKEPLKTAILVVANYQAPTEKFLVKEEDCEYEETKEGEVVLDKTLNLPGDCQIKAEFVFDGKNYVEKETSEPENSLHFEKLLPSEFKIYLLSK